MGTPMHVRSRDLFQALVNVSSHTRPTNGRRAPNPAEAPGATTAPQRTAAQAPETKPKEKDATAALTYERAEKTSLKLRTQEGDVVRVRIQNRSSMKAAHTMAADGADGFQEPELESKSASRLRIKVKGHLNADEMAAVQDAIGQASDIADHFFANDLEGAFDTASALSLDTDQLAGMKLKLRLRETATYSAPAQLPKSHPEPVSSLHDAPAPGQADAPNGPLQAGTSPAENAPQPAAPADRPLPPAAVPDTVPTDGPGDPVAPDPAATTPLGDPNAMADALRAIGDFMAHLFETIGDSGRSRPADRLDVSLKLRIVRVTIETLAESRAETEGSIPALLGDTLDALAAAEGPRVDKVA